MKAQDETLGASVRAFRAATAAPADGETTRARVLGLVERGRERRARWRRMGVVFIVVLASVPFGSAAWTALGHWRARTFAPAPAQTAASSPRGISATAASTPATAVAGPIVEIPVDEAPPARVGASDARVASSPSATGDAEARLYARAHEAHFTRDAPAEALAAWNRYLAAFPRGAFVPDARYNRALCLLRLGQRAAAAQALRSFADGEYHGYRRVEADALLDWLARQAP
jgi:TolA-binding protein